MYIQQNPRGVYVRDHQSIKIITKPSVMRFRPNERDSEMREREKRRRVSHVIYTRYNNVLALCRKSRRLNQPSARAQHQIFSLSLSLRLYTYIYTI